ncbi:hypothetical protein ACWD6R_40655, partial [Streptomyces sp. NPDC005151]
MHPVSAGQIAGPLVTAQYRQDDPCDLSRGQGPPPRADLLAVAASEKLYAYRSCGRFWSNSGFGRVILAGWVHEDR